MCSRTARTLLASPSTKAVSDVQDKVAKFENRVMGTLADMAGVKTCGVVGGRSPEKGLVKIAKPVGVIAALIPTTGPDATPPVKALGALKARNAIIVSPHPRTKRTSIAVVEAMPQGLPATSELPRI